jgi:urease accessory protein UreF
MSVREQTIEAGAEFRKLVVRLCACTKWSERKRESERQCRKKVVYIAKGAKQHLST